MRSCASAVGATILLCAASASAQPAQPAPALTAPAVTAQVLASPAPPIAATSAALKHLPAGTVVDIEITEPVSSNGGKPGQAFSLRLAEPVVVEGVIVLPAGLTGAGEIIDAQGAGFAGTSGKLVLAARYVTYEGRKIPLKALKFGVSGRSHVAEATGIGFILPVAGLIIRGGETLVQPGARATAKIAEDLDLPAQPTPAPAVASTQPNQGSHQ